VGIDESGKQGGAAGVDDPRTSGVVAQDAAIDHHSGGPAKFAPIEHAHVSQRDPFAATRLGAAEQIRHVVLNVVEAERLRDAVASLCSKRDAAQGVGSRVEPLLADHRQQLQFLVAFAARCCGEHQQRL
jgi:hypothetical protein